MSIMADKKGRLFLLFLTVGVVCFDLSSSFRIKEDTCYRCTSANVSCGVELMSSCFLPMVGNIWPSDPRDLKAVAVKKDDCWAANFSWKPPYDSSIKSLTGFKLTLNVVEDGDNVYITGHPICIFVNLSSPEWNNWVDTQQDYQKYDITFYSECLCVINPATVDLHLTSYPHPPDFDQIKSVNIRLKLPGVQEDYLDEWSPWIRWKLKENGHSVDIEIKFGPPFPEAATYKICLEEISSRGYCANVTHVPAGQNELTFGNIGYNKNYSIMIRPKGKGGEWLIDYYSVSEDFRVPVPTSGPVMLTMEPEHAGSSPAEIGLVVLVTALVIMVAVSVFFICRTDYFVSLRCSAGHRDYSLPAINQRNNNIGDSEVSSIFFVHFPDNEKHTKMAHAVYVFMKTVCKLNVVSEHDYKDDTQQSFQEWIGDHLTDNIVLLSSPGLARSYNEALCTDTTLDYTTKSKTCCLTVLNYIKLKQLENQHIYVITPIPEVDHHMTSLTDLKVSNIILARSNNSGRKNSYLYSDEDVERLAKKFQQGGFNHHRILQNDWKRTIEARHLLDTINEYFYGQNIELSEFVDSGFHSNSEVMYTVTAPMLQGSVGKDIQYIGISAPSHFIPPECDTSSIESDLSQQIVRLNERNGK